MDGDNFVFLEYFTVTAFILITTIIKPLPRHGCFLREEVFKLLITQIHTNRHKIQFKEHFSHVMHTNMQDPDQRMNDMSWFAFGRSKEGNRRLNLVLPTSTRMPARICLPCLPIRYSRVQSCKLFVTLFFNSAPRNNGERTSVR